MYDLVKTVTFALVGIFLIKYTNSTETLNGIKTNSSELIGNSNNTIQSENKYNNSSTNHTLNEQVANNTEKSNQSLSSDNAMEICNHTFQTPKGIRI